MFQNKIVLNTKTIVIINKHILNLKKTDFENTLVRQDKYTYFVCLLPRGLKENFEISECQYLGQK